MKSGRPAGPWAVAGLAGRRPRWAEKEGGLFRSDRRVLVRVLGRPAGPGGEGAEVWARRGWSLQTPACWGPSGKPGSSIPEVPSGGSRAAGSPRYGPAALLCLPLEWSLARAWPRGRQGLCLPWHLLASPRVTDTAPSPSSAPAEAHLWSSKQGSRVPSDPSRAAFQQRGIKMRRKTENSPFGLLAPVLLTSGLIAAAVLLFSVGG